MFRRGVKSLVANDDGTAAEHGVDQFGRECFRGPVKQPRRVGQPRPGVQVGLELADGDPAADHQGERENPSYPVPDRAGRVVDETLRGGPRWRVLRRCRRGDSGAFTGPEESPGHADDSARAEVLAGGTGEGQGSGHGHSSFFVGTAAPEATWWAGPPVRPHHVVRN